MGYWTWVRGWVGGLSYFLFLSMYGKVRRTRGGLNELLSSNREGEQLTHPPTHPQWPLPSSPAPSPSTTTALHSWQ